ncbi:unnamed protein product [Cylicocyclus nassatus]|uniref:Globin domain-containing protein n=1 Tax=Cylicocyclus nassatus TaxID=53992 RepID=A0AA36HDJ7_CYLNA|nr:unnamed protein product [Cylicocyclus nassatus]
MTMMESRISRCRPSSHREMTRHQYVMERNRAYANTLRPPDMLSLTVPSTPRTARSLSPSPVRQNMHLMRTGSERDSMRERSGSISAARAMIPMCPSLMPSQVSAIRKSWRHINTKGLITVLSRCFQRLESSCPVAQACFSSQSPSPSNAQSPVRTVADHARFLLNLLDRIIDAEQDLEEIREIGARHVPLKHECGLGAAELDRFQEIFVEVLLKQDGIRQSKEASRAWRILICAIVDLFRDGFETQLRQFRRKHSFNAHTEYFENIERRASLCPYRKASLNVDPRLDTCTKKLSQLNV